jgi:hypothetical protein
LHIAHAYLAITGEDEVNLGLRVGQEVLGRCVMDKELGFGGTLELHK